MASMRARYPVDRIPYVGVEDSDYNTTNDTWGDPVRVYVYGVNYPQSSEPTEVGSNRLLVDCVLLTPKNFQTHPKDRYQLPKFPDPEQLFEVVGIPEDGEGNPYGWNPGGRLKLVRING